MAFSILFGLGHQVGDLREDLVTDGKTLVTVGKTLETEGKWEGLGDQREDLGHQREDLGNQREYLGDQRDDKVFLKPRRWGQILQAQDRG